jgi:hypothetical protein
LGIELETSALLVPEGPDPPPGFDPDAALLHPEEILKSQ